MHHVLIQKFTFIKINKPFMKFLPFIFRMLLALPMLIFGANKFIEFMPAPPLEPGSLPALFFTGLASTYLIYFIGLTEIVAAILLLFKKTSAFGALILMPISLNIVAYHLFVDGDTMGMGIGFFILVLNAGILYFNKARLLPIINEEGAA